MAEIAEFLYRQVRDKTVVITGAMIPYTFNRSDGLFNLGSAIAFVQLLSPGIYVVMNGRHFLAGIVQRIKRVDCLSQGKKSINSGK